MRVHRYIYARLEKEQSPRGKSGFQSAFLPEIPLESSKIMEIESRIHLPEAWSGEQKHVHFYLDVAGQAYRVILMAFPQKAMKDVHGRSGVFLVEGFLIDASECGQARDAAELIELLEGFCFRDLNKLLESEVLDKEKGLISSLDTPIKEGYWESLMAADEEEVVAPLLMALYHQAKGKLEDAALVLQGQPKSVTKAFGKAASYLPKSLANTANWDDAFDGGKVFFSPMRLFGFSQSAPVTGKQVVFEPSFEKAQWPDGLPESYAKASDPFSVWLLEVSVNPPNPQAIEDAFALNEALIAAIPPKSPIPIDPLFAALNEQQIHQFFQMECTIRYGEEWGTVLARELGPAEQLQVWMQGFPSARMASLLKTVMLSKQIGPFKEEKAPPAELVEAGGLAMRLLASMWTEKLPESMDLEQLSDDELHDILKLMLGEGKHENLYLQPMIAQPVMEPHLRAITRQEEMAASMKTYMQPLVPAVFANCAEEVAEMTIRMGQFGALNGGKTDWYYMVERWLIETGGNSAAWKAIPKLANEENITSYPILYVFTGKSKKIPQQVEHSQAARRGLIKALIEVHGWKEQALLDMGFFGVEIKDSGSQMGFMGKVKRLFKR